MQEFKMYPLSRGANLVWSKDMMATFKHLFLEGYSRKRLNALIVKKISKVR